MEATKPNEEQAFYLKRSGAFKEALRAYAREYAQNLRQENPFIAQVCFEEMVDTSLLHYLKEDRLFETKEKLVAFLRNELLDILKSQEAYDGKSFDEHFRSCQRKLFPRGKGKTPFSVDRRLLLRKERKALLRA